MNCSFNLLLLGISTLKISIVVHLVLRGIWTGLVGLSYVYPHGIISEKLRPKAQKFLYDQPVDLVISMEKQCSLMFSYIFIVVYFLAMAVIFYIPVMLFYILGLDSIIPFNSLVVLGIAGAVLLIIANILENRSGKHRRRASLHKNVSAILRSNNAHFLRVVVALVFLAFLLSTPLIVKFQFRNNTPGLATEGILVPFNDEDYSNLRNNDYRLAKACLNEKDIESNAMLFIPYYKEDRILFSNIEDFKRESDLDEITSTLDLFTIYLDDAELGHLDWMLGPNQYTGQKGYQTLIPLDHLPKGLHVIRISKYVWQGWGKGYKQIDNWYSIPFQRI